jgi:hypothetical protein
VSAPVYDRDQDPPLFLGVAAIDFAMEFALGVDEDNQQALNRFVRRSTARCPVFNITECEMEKGGAEAFAQYGKVNCTDDVTRENVHLRTAIPRISGLL